MNKPFFDREVFCPVIDLAEAEEDISLDLPVKPITADQDKDPNDED